MQGQKDIQIAYGRVLREYREAAGLSQEKLAALAEMDRTYISLLERGRRNPSLTAIMTLSQFIGISATEQVELVEAMMASGDLEQT